MALSKLYDAGGNVLTDANGNILYVEVITLDPRHVAKVPYECNVAKVTREKQVSKNGQESGMAKVTRE